MLVVSPEPLCRGTPAGSGIRLLELTNVLRSTGHAVKVMSPDGPTVTTPSALRDETMRHDLALVQGHVANDLIAHGNPRLPVVVDLYDPFVVEHLYYRSEEIFRHDLDTTRRSLARGDFFLCASDEQRLFWIGALMATGRAIPKWFSRDPRLTTVMSVVPFGVTPPPTTRPNRERFALIFGTIYEWYDPILAIEGVRKARETLPALTLAFQTHPNEEQTPRALEREVRAYVARERLESFIRFDPWREYERRAEYYAQFSAALSIVRRSIENDVAMRTRLVDFQWAGLPIINSDDAATASGIASAIVAAHEPARYASARPASRSWTDVAEPLLEFCANPRRLQ